MVRLVIPSSLLSLLLSTIAWSLVQADTSKAGLGTVLVTPGVRYEASWLHRLFYGSLWRDLWTTPLEVQRLNLDRYAGGLTPLRRGGGKETNALHMKGNDGKRYKFRSTDKEAKKTLPTELQESIAADFLQDLVSGSNPLAALIVSPLLDATGVVHARPRLVVLPNAERLGEFQKEFGGILGTLEENPRGGSAEEDGFAGADKVINTLNLFKRLEEDHDEQVDAREFLKARLMDIFVGDWDRHYDQWRWAGFKDENRWLWIPIPTDRDKAFARFNGFFPWVVTKAIREFNHFSDSYPNVEDLTWHGRHLDRRLLISLDWAVWDSVTSFVVGSLTDSIIEDAVRILPPEMYALEGEFLEKTLKARRAKLPKVSREYYELSLKYPDVWGSNKSEVAEIDRLDGRGLHVALYKREKSSGQKKGPPFFEKTFHGGATEEVRIYLLGGNDKAVVGGEVGGGIKVMINGGEGDDELIDSSGAGARSGSLFSILSTHKPRTDFYDPQEETRHIAGIRKSVRKWEERATKDETEKYFPRIPDYGYLWRPSLWFSSSPDDGIFLGGGPIRYGYGYEAQPFVSKMELRGGAATATGRFRGEFSGEFRSWIEDATFFLHLRASQLDILNFFGQGNETSLNKDLQRSGYYKIRQGQYVLHPSIEWRLLPRWKISMGGALKYVENQPSAGTLIEIIRTYGSQGSFKMLRLDGRLRVGAEGEVPWESSDWFVEVEGQLFPKLVDNESHFGKIRADIRAYVPAGSITNAMLALRIAGEKIWGRYPFFESSFLGGAKMIRGFERQRFAGDASLHGNAELRISLGKLAILIPETYGISFFVEAGKVFVSGESSKRWHSGVGAGVWFYFIYPENLVNISLARSREKTAIYVTSGFTF